MFMAMNRASKSAIWTCRDCCRATVLPCKPRFRQLLDVVYQTIKRPLRIHFGLATQREPVELLVVPDIGKHWLNGGHALAVEFASPGAVNGPLHALGELVR